jgi:hypothetical protein
LQDFPPEKWDAILAIDLSSAFHTSPKMSISRVLDETKSFAFTGPTIYPRTQRWIGYAGHVVGLARAECLGCGIKEETSPLRFR